MKKPILNYLISFLLLLVLGCGGNNNLDPASMKGLPELVDDDENLGQGALLPVITINTSAVASPPVYSSSNTSDPVITTQEQEKKEKIRAGKKKADHEGDFETDNNDDDSKSEAIYEEWRKHQSLKESGEEGEVESSLDGWREQEQKKHRNHGTITDKQNVNEDLGGLPPEMWDNVLSHVPTKEINLYREVNKAFDILVKEILQKRLPIALQEGKIDEFNDFIKAGVNIYARNKQGIKLVYLMDSSDKVILLKRWVVFNQANPLHIASSANSIALAKQSITELTQPDALKDIQCELTKLKKFKQRPFDQDTTIKEAELKKKKRDILREKKAGINKKDKDGFTPFHIAIREGYVDLIYFLIKAGANVHIRNCKNSTPLHTAASNGDLNACRFLIRLKSKVNARDNYKSTPLLNALITGQDIKIVKLLLENGANINVKDSNGFSPLLAAILAASIERNSIERNIEIVKILIEHGADVNVKNSDSTTPLLAASISGNTEIVKVLIENRADVNIKNNYGDTPLLDASSEGHIEIVKLLLENGARVNVIDLNGNTPLHYANLKGHVEIVKILSGKETNVKIRKNYSNNPLREANFWGYVNTTNISSKIDTLVKVKDSEENTLLFDITPQRTTAKAEFSSAETLNDKLKYAFAISTVNIDFLDVGPIGFLLKNEVFETVIKK